MKFLEIRSLRRPYEGMSKFLICLELSVNLARVQARLTLDIPP